MSDPANETVTASSQEVAAPAPVPTAEEIRASEAREAFNDIYPILGEMELQLREQGLSLPRILADLIKTTPYKVQF